jgi:uncharacterized protein (TIGR02271 family)
VLGGLLGAGAALLIPGIGPVVAGGILAATFGGAAIGAVAGGLIGALTAMDIPEDEARYYESEFKSGRTLVTVKADNRAAEATSILRRHGAYDAHTEGDTMGTGRTTMMDTGHTTMDTGRSTMPSGGRTETRHTGTEGNMRVQAREEELRAQKQTVQAGEVEVRKEVVTEHRSMEVPVTREEVYVERHPVEGRASSGPIGESETIRVPVYEEQVTVQKTPVVREEVEIGRRAVTENQHVEGTVRREEIHVDRQGGNWNEVMPSFRTSWQQRYGSSGGRWEDYEPGYRYGWEMAGKPEYRGRSWTQVEPEFRRDWETRHHDKPWDRIGDTIREGWERMTGGPGSDGGHYQQHRTV